MVDEETPLVRREQEDESTTTTTNNNWFAKYCELVEERPLIVKGITAFFILGLGDACAQMVEHLLGSSNATNSWDWIRTIRFGGFGLIGAPWAHYYFYYLDKYLPPTEEACTRTTWIKLLIDQGAQAPIILALFIGTMAILKGEQHPLKALQDTYWSTLVANWQLWIPASLLNLAVVQPSLRVLYVNVVFFVWTIILSILLNQ